MPNRPVRECIKRDKPLVGAAEELVQAVAMRMAEACCSSILLCKEGRLNGIFTERDLLMRVVAAGLDPATTPVGAVMTRDPDRIEAKLRWSRRSGAWTKAASGTCRSCRGTGSSASSRGATCRLRSVPGCSPSSINGTSWPSACGSGLQAPPLIAARTACSRPPVERQAPCCGLPV